MNKPIHLPSFYELRLRLGLFAVLGCGLLSSCSYFSGVNPESDCYWGQAIYKNENPLVRNPAKAGYYAGADLGLVVAIPVSVLAIPIAAGGHEGGGWMITSICNRFMNFTGSVMGTAIGSPCWLMFGWWPEDTNSKKNALGQSPEDQKPGHDQ